MESIKLWDGIRITVDGQSEIVRDGGFPEVWKKLNMSGQQYHELQIEIVRWLSRFGHYDLTPNFGYKVSVVLDVVND